MCCGERVSLSVGECSLSCVTLEDRAVLLTDSSLCDAETFGEFDILQEYSL